jgi:tetratricopeptide (TPR) repeat protein
MELARRALILWIIAGLPSLAQRAIERGDYTLAISCLDAYRCFSSDDPRIHIMLGWAHFKQGDHSRAIDAYTAAIRLDPNEAAAYLGRGAAYGAAGRLDQAIDDLTEALRLDPDSADACYNRGLAYAQKRRFDRALADFDRVVDQQPENTEALRQRALVHCETKRYARAVADYESVLRREPRNESVRQMLVDLLATCPNKEVRNLARADDLANRFDACAPGSHRVCALLAAAHAQRGDIDRAIAWQRKALACADPLDKEEKRRTALVLKLYRTRKKQADRASSRRDKTGARPPQDGGQ